MKTRNGFVSNSSSSSFIIGNDDISRVATQMFNIVISEWSAWRSKERNNNRVYQEWQDNLKEGLRRKDVQDGIIGITFPSTNYETYMIKKDGKVYVTTANNHNWDGVEDIVRLGQGADDEVDICYEVIQNCDFFNIRNGLIHSSDKCDGNCETKCPECNNFYGQYVILDGVKICGSCFKGVVDKKHKKIPIVEIPKTKSISLSNREIKELINGLDFKLFDCSCHEQDKEVAKDLRAKLEKILKEKYDA